MATAIVMAGLAMTMRPVKSETKYTRYKSVKIVSFPRQNGYIAEFERIRKNQQQINLTHRLGRGWYCPIFEVG